MNETALDKIYRYYWKNTIDLSNKRINALKTLLKVFCAKLEIEEPTLYLCYVDRQNNCIRKKKGVPCAGGCYVASTKQIFIREAVGGLDTLLHEIFHHVNYLNGSKAIRTIMNAWTRQEFEIAKGYGELLREHGIPMRKPK